MSKNFREKDFEKRHAEYLKIKEKYPERVPVIVEKSGTSDLPDLDKKKFLVPEELGFGNFKYIIQKRIKLSSEQALFVFIGKNTIPKVTETMGQLHADHKEADGFLYLTYTGENVFGSEDWPGSEE